MANGGYLDSTKFPSESEILSLWVTCALTFYLPKNLCKDKIFVMKPDRSRVGPMKAMVQPVKDYDCSYSRSMVLASHQADMVASSHTG